MGLLFRNIRSRLTPLYDEREANAIALLLVEKVGCMTTADVLTGKDDSLMDDAKERIETMTCRLERGEPLQYVVGEADFCGLTIGVEPGVLIPRPETECLVRLAPVERMDGCRRILDIGTGSGCIALALKHRCPQAEVSAWDISDKALEVAGRNARKLDLDVQFRCVDVLSDDLPKEKQYDIIVSNPPYICLDEKTAMHRNVVDYEPHEALFVPDQSPLLFYEAIARYASQMLTDGGWLGFEINRRFGKEVAQMMEEKGFEDVEITKDQFDNDRIVSGWKQRRRN